MLAEAVALDVMQVWLSDLHRTVEERAGTLDIADGEQLQRWREGLRSQPHRAGAPPQRRPRPLQHRARRGREAEADRDRARRRAQSADLRAALAFARGGAGAGSR